MDEKAFFPDACESAAQFGSLEDTENDNWAKDITELLANF